MAMPVPRQLVILGIPIRPINATWTRRRHGLATESAHHTTIAKQPVSDFSVILTHNQSMTQIAVRIRLKAVSTIPRMSKTFHRGASYCC
jgi:hypothetical protein